MLRASFCSPSAGLLLARCEWCVRAPFLVLRCRAADREARLFFHFSEAGFPKPKIVEGAEVSFSAAADEVLYFGRCMAISFALSRQDVSARFSVVWCMLP